MFWEGKPTGKHLHSTNGDQKMLVWLGPVPNPDLDWAFFSVSNR